MRYWNVIIDASLSPIINYVCHFNNATGDEFNYLNTGG